MNPSRHSALEAFERMTRILFMITLPAAVIISLYDSDEKSLLVAGGLIFNIFVFTAWMIAGSINQRRRVESLIESIRKNNPPEEGQAPPDGDRPDD